MKTHFLKLTILFILLFAFNRSQAQDLSSKGIQELFVMASPTEYSVSGEGDSLFARYLTITYLNSPSGAKFTLLVQNISDTAQVQQLVNAEYTVPAADADNNGLYSLDRTGNTIRVFIGNLSLLSRFRMQVWIESEEQVSYSAEF